jgi:phenylpropionate dioxygenase-like ring-hydroxylating dioxygenase large terminal subunit
MFLQNAWYVAAWDREIGRTPLARTILDEPVVLYRKEDGTPVALEDRCCHRHLPLSKGAVIGNDLRCGYHGLLYDASGACIEIPGQPAIPPGARIRSYPVVEKWNWIWIWMGEPARADVALIPDWWWPGHPDWRFVRPDPLYIKANYQLINDNVLDVTHLAYVHATSIGTAAITDFPAHVEHGERFVRLTRLITDRPPPPLYQRAGGFAGHVDRAQIVEHVPPCFTINYAGCTAVGSRVPQGARGKSVDAITRSKGEAPDQANTDRKIDLMALSAPTPETATTTHYFFGFVRNFGHDDPAIEKILAVDFVNVFREDLVVLEAQQQMMSLKPGAPQVDIRVDAAPLAARRILSGLMAGERPAVPAAAVR